MRILIILVEFVALSLEYSSERVGLVPPSVLIMWPNINQTTRMFLQQRDFIEHTLAPALPIGSRVVLESIGYTHSHRKTIFNGTLGDRHTMLKENLHKYEPSNPTSTVSASSLFDSVFSSFKKQKKVWRSSELLFLVLPPYLKLETTSGMRQIREKKKTFVVLYDAYTGGSSDALSRLATDTEHVFYTSDFDRESFRDTLTIDMQLPCDVDEYFDYKRLACGQCRGVCKITDEPVWETQEQKCRDNCRYYLCMRWKTRPEFCHAFDQPPVLHDRKMRNAHPVGQSQLNPLALSLGCPIILILALILLCARPSQFGEARRHREQKHKEKKLHEKQSLEREAQRQKCLQRRMAESTSMKTTRDGVPASGCGTLSPCQVRVPVQEQGPEEPQRPYDLENEKNFNVNSNFGGPLNDIHQGD